ncbi:MAG: Ig protein [Firmicutes bacterium]|nr:Ig protein [Bacillota bacterium]
MKTQVRTALAASLFYLAASITTPGFAANNDSHTGELTLKHLSSYATGFSNPDGGVAEIVKFNPDNKKMYLVNGMTKTVDIVTLTADGTTKFNAATDRIDVSKTIASFNFGDITSVDVNTKHKIIALAVQEADYSKAGAIVILDYNGKLIKHVAAGVQPDMVTFTPDGNSILTANEGEPRLGYEAGSVDPQGSVTIVDLRKGVEKATAVTVGFEGFDAKRDQLIADKVLLKQGAAPGVDLEPEYIAVSADSKKAYVSLQEANAIASLDIKDKKFTAIKGLGFKDHSIEKNAVDLLKDKKIDIKPQQVYGAYMPDGIASYESKGSNYILTANEGDGREWGAYTNIATAVIDGQKVDALKNTEHVGLSADKVYTFGGRSFSIWQADTLQQVFDSGSDFESIAAKKYPKYFNASNKDVVLDSRSGKKGPEPEDVKVGRIGDKVYAFIGLERMGGVMTYNITDPANAYFVDYCNTRDFSANIAGDVSPEGLCFVAADKSPTGRPLLLAANEVSGTVAIFEVHSAAK